MISIQYAAGFTDGEGSVSIYLTSSKGRPMPHVRVAISNYIKEPLAQMKVRWGGSLSQTARSGLWVLCLNGLPAYRFLVDVRPYLLVKSGCAREAIALFHANTYLERVACAVRVMEETKKGGHADRPAKTITTLRAVLQEESGGDVPTMQ